MHNKIFRPILGFLACLMAGHAQAQSYSAYPDLPFSPVALDWSIRLNPDIGGFSATAVYTFRSNRADAYTVALAQKDLEIEGVTQGEESIPFVINGDSIRITLPAAPERDSEITLAISYQAYPVYGYFLESDGASWTSGMPGSLPSLLPVLEHPRLQLRTQITMVHPPEFHAVANGSFVSRANGDEGQVQTLFRTRAPIPVSGIRFAVGRYVPSEQRSGTIPVRFYADSSMFSPAERKALSDLALAEVGRMSAALKSPYPFEALSVVARPSSYAEAWGDAAGMVFLFQDYGALDSQLKLALASQWFGQALRGYNDSDRYHLSGYARAVAEASALGTFSAQLTPLAGLELSVDARSVMAQQQAGYPLAEFPLADGIRLLAHAPGAVGAAHIEEARYQHDMRRRSTVLPSLIHIQMGSGTPAEAGYVFKVARTDEPTVLKLVIDPYGEPAEGNLVAHLVEVYPDTLLRQPIRFEQSGGEADVEVDADILNVFIELEGAAFRVEKPLGYWLHQIRRGATQQEKIEAAAALGDFAADPDLQLVVRDLERAEPDPEVRAALVVSLAQASSAGSVSAYRDMLERPEGVLRLAAIKALGFRQGDEAALELLKAHFVATGEAAERAAVAQSVRQIASAEAYADFSREYLMGQSAGSDALQLLSAYFSEGETDQGILFADSLLQSVQPYEVSMRALALLDEHDQDVSRWQQRLPRLASDQDPRIRLLALELTHKLDPSQQQILLRDRAAKEADPRVRIRIARF